MDNQQSSLADQFWTLFAKKLTKEASAQELEIIHSFLINNPGLQYQADLISEMWQQSGQQFESEEGEAAYVRHLMKYKNEFFLESLPVDLMDEPEQPYEEKGRRFRKIISGRKKVFLIFSVLLLFAVVSVYIIITQKSSHGAQTSLAISSVVTRNGNRTKIVLPDGSQVWLNAGSKFDYDDLVFNKSVREVTLYGEAYFDVTKNPEKPFIIHTRKMDIKVLGTAFNVRSYNDEKFAEAALIRGSIEVTLKDRKNQKLILKPNEKISISTEETQNEDEKNQVRKTETSVAPQILVIPLQPNPKINVFNEIAWTQNKLCFQGEDLENISQTLERWFGKKVVIENESLKRLKFTGTFEKETVEEILNNWKLSNPSTFNFRNEKDEIIIYK